MKEDSIIRRLVILVFLCLALRGVAGVRGTVVDGSDASPVPGATVTLLDGRSVVLRMTVTDSDGMFSVPDSIPELALVRISSVGYDMLDISDPTVGDLGTIRLNPSSAYLSAVTVTAERRKHDATTETIFLTDSIRGSSSNAAAMIGGLPGFRTDLSTEEIHIGNNLNVPVLVNGRDMGAQYARSLNPRRIKSIQIQRYPPGEFSEVPILVNIVLYEDYSGWDMALRTFDSTRLRSRPSNSESASVDFTYSIREWTAYLSGSYRKSVWREALGFAREVAGLEPEVTEPADYRHPNASERSGKATFSVGAERRIGGSHVISLQTWIDHADVRARKNYSMDNGGDMLDADDYRSLNSVTGLFYNGAVSDRLRIASSLQYNYYGIREDRMFSDGLQYSPSRIDGRKDYLFLSTYVSGKLSERWGIMADYSYTWRKYRSRRERGEDSFESGELRNRLRLLASYRHSPAFNILAGAEMIAVTDHQDGMRDSHTSVMPWVQLFWQPLRQIRINAVFRNWIEYPNFDQLSTDEWQVSRNVVQTGNPSLRSKIVNYLMPKVTLFDLVSLEYMLRRSSDDIVDWYLIDGRGRVIKTFANCSYLHQYAGLSLDRTLGGGVRLQFSCSYQWYRRWTSEFNGNGHSWTGDLTLAWKPVEKGPSFTGEYFLRQDREPLPQGSTYRQQEYLSISVSHAFCSGRLPVSAGIHLPVSLLDKRTYTRIDILGYCSETYGDDRVNNFLLFLNVRFSVGKGKVRKQGNSYEIDQEK